MPTETLQINPNDESTFSGNKNDIRKKVPDILLSLKEAYPDIPIDIPSVIKVVDSETRAVAIKKSFEPLAQKYWTEQRVDKFFEMVNQLPEVINSHINSPDEQTRAETVNRIDLSLRSILVNYPTLAPNPETTNHGFPSFESALMIVLASALGTKQGELFYRPKALSRLSKKVAIFFESSLPLQKNLSDKLDQNLSQIAKAHQNIKTYVSLRPDGIRTMENLKKHVYDIFIKFREYFFDRFGLPEVGPLNSYETALALITAEIVDIQLGVLSKQQAFGRN